MVSILEKRTSLEDLTFEEYNDLSINEIVEKYNTTKPTVYRKINKEGWLLKTDEPIPKTFTINKWINSSIEDLCKEFDKSQKKIKRWAKFLNYPKKEDKNNILKLNDLSYSEWSSLPDEVIAKKYDVDLKIVKNYAKNEKYTNDYNRGLKNPISFDLSEWENNPIWFIAKKYKTTDHVVLRWAKEKNFPKKKKIYNSHSYSIVLNYLLEMGENEYYKTPLKDLKFKFGYSMSFIIDVADSIGWSKLAYGDIKPGKKCTMPEEFTEELYEKYSYDELSEIFDVCKTTIGNWKRKKGFRNKIRGVKRCMNY